MSPDPLAGGKVGETQVRSPLTLEGRIGDDGLLWMECHVQDRVLFHQRKDYLSGPRLVQGERAVARPGRQESAVGREATHGDRIGEAPKGPLSFRRFGCPEFERVIAAEFGILRALR